MRLVVMFGLVRVRSAVRDDIVGVKVAVLRQSLYRRDYGTGVEEGGMGQARTAIAGCGNPLSLS